MLFYQTYFKSVQSLFFTALVHPDSQSLGFLSMTQCEALSCIEVTRGEYLLVFNLLAVYVDASGRKSREKELMYPAIPTAVGQYWQSNGMSLKLKNSFKIHKVKNQISCIRSIW